MVKFIPSPQQAVFFDWIKSGHGNAFVQAVAGAGKTTSLVEGAKLMKGSKAFLAFNKKIADEIGTKLVANKVANAEASTFHSMGMKAWGKFVGSRIKVDAYKIPNLIQDHKNIDEEYAGFVTRLVSLAKQSNFVPDTDIANWQGMVDKHDLGSDLGKNQKVEIGIGYAIAILAANNRMRNTIDFDDMIYFPVVNAIEMPIRFDWVMVDEAQDTNPTRRAMAGMLCKPNGRMVFVGDKHQAIYGFTGADADAVDLIIKAYKCTELPLTVTYRCPKAVVQAAQAYVSHITAHDSAPEGEVSNVSRADFESTGVKSLVGGQDAILCRKVAPLVKTAYSLIRSGVACQIEGKSDIGKQILQMLNKWKRVKSLADFIDKLSDWETSQVAKHTDEKGNPKKNKETLIENIRDRAETIRFLCEGCNDMQCVKDKIGSMFGDTPEGGKSYRVILSTVHKSKGREFKRVYVLGFNEYMPSKMAKQAWQIEQENNLIYVAMTRAQKKLVLVG